MDRILLIIIIVILAIQTILSLVFIFKKKKDGKIGDGGNMLGEIENLNDNLNEVKNIVNEHTTREKDNIISSFNSSNGTLIQMLETYMKSFKQTLAENLNTTKEQLNEIREEMRIATRQMSANTTDALEKMQDKTEKSLSNLKDDTGKSLDRMNDEIKSSLKDMREDNQKQLLGVKQDNEKQLEKMRETVDEKLSGTLDKRIQNAFEIVNDRLDKVQRGFGEMQDLSTKVTNLNKMFANVKTRGGWGEVALESLLDQILSPEQYGKQFRLSKGSQEAVDFVIVMPGQGEEKVYLPIDSKFPLDKYIRLVEA
ncbi:MAG: DNA recombination protein RmuC, partial [Clostridia bacterium]|nr:DNA recombination protein RmuC [Clostridia bacterium]